jgi:hypothetical protein
MRDPPSTESRSRAAAAPRSGSGASRSAAGLAIWAAAGGHVGPARGREIVLADECDEERHGDLFWALRGAGAHVRGGRDRTELRCLAPMSHTESTVDDHLRGRDPAVIRLYERFVELVEACRAVRGSDPRR